MEDKMWMMESRNSRPDIMEMEQHPLMRMLLKKNIGPNHPYTYQQDPMASVPLVRVPASKISSYSPKMKVMPYHHEMQAKPYHHEMTPYHEMLESTFKDWTAYMKGEQFFKEQLDDKINYPEHESEDESEELPYETVQDYGTYEKRRIFAASYACVQDKVDTAADSLAGIVPESLMEVMQIMASARYQKRPSSAMFRELFKYISGVNDRGEEINMTRPVTTLHHVERKDYLGNVEIQEMCFYLPEAYQSEHEHEDAGPSPRHIALTAPKPLENSKVFIHIRPEMEVYVRTFGGYAINSDTWEAHKKALEDDLIGKPHHDHEFFTVGYNSPMHLFNRRNEVWIQSVEPGHPVIQAVVAAGPHHDQDHDEDVEHHHLDQTKSAPKPVAQTNAKSKASKKQQKKKQKA